VVRFVQQGRHRFTELCSIAGGHRALGARRFGLARHRRMAEPGSRLEIGSQSTNAITRCCDVQWSTLSSWVGCATVRRSHSYVVMQVAESNPVAYSTYREWQLPAQQQAQDQRTKVNLATTTSTSATSVNVHARSTRSNTNCLASEHCRTFRPFCNIDAMNI